MSLIIETFIQRTARTAIKQNKAKRISSFDSVYVSISETLHFNVKIKLNSLIRDKISKRYFVDTYLARSTFDLLLFTFSLVYLK